MARLPRRSIWEPLLLFALPFALYAGSLSFGLIGYDDTRYYLVNPAIRDPSDPFSLWTHSFYSDYMPLTQLTWWLDLLLFGDQAWWGARLHGLVWFGIGTLGVRALVSRVTGRRELAFAVALLFALHPVCAHSLLWLAQRKNLVAFAFSIWAVERYVAAREDAGARPSLGRVGAAFALTGLALLSKAHAVAVPALCAAWELARGRGPWSARGLALAPVTLAAAAFVAANLFGLRADLGGAPDGGGVLARALADGPILLRYLRLVFAPLDLSSAPTVSFFYAVDDAPGLLGLAAWAGFAAIAAATSALAREPRLVAWGWLFGLAGLLPALDLVAQPQPMADQYLLWALPGWLCAGALVAERVLAAPPAFLRAAYLVTAVAFAFVALQRTSEYASPRALFEATLVHQPDAALGWSEYARALRAEGDVAPQEVGAAALKALTRPDAQRILEIDRPALIKEAALSMHAAGKEEEAWSFLERETSKLSPPVAPLGDLEKADFALRTGRPERAVVLLAPAFAAVPRSVVATLRRECRSGARLPHQIESQMALSLYGDAADREFNRRAILRQLELYARAQLESGRPEIAFDAAAVLVHVAPDYRPGREVLAASYRALGVRFDEDALGL